MKDKSKQKKKSVQQSAKGTAEPKAVVEQDSPISEQSDDDDSGVDEKGMERLMAALGEDGLDEVGESMLKTLDGGVVGDENSDDSGVGSSVEEEDDEESEESGDSEDEDEENEEEGEYVPKVKLRAGLSSDEEDDEEDEDEDENEEQEENAKSSKSSTSKRATKNDTSASHLSGQDDDADIALDEASGVDEDAIPQQKLTVNNKRALESILASIQLNKSMPWTETLTTTYPQTHDVDVSNDLERELSFYKQALHSVEAAKKLAAEHSLPFTRPSDFFAEMVKSDAHMERTRQRLLDETSQIKRSEDKRREREGKKFGKQVQLEKLKERERSKKELGEKIQGLKRKRNSGALDGDDGDFDIALEEAMEDRQRKKPKMPRNKRDEKYGFGGKGSTGWRSKQNTRDSTDQFVSGKSDKKGKKGGKHVPKRPGKARRMANRQK